MFRSAGFISLLAVACSGNFTPSSYERTREELIRHEQEESIRGAQALSPAELIADAVLAEARDHDLSHGPAGSRALPATSFLGGAKQRIVSGRLWPLLVPMPKGAALHVHSDSMVDVEWIVSNISYEPMLYFCGRTPSTTITTAGGGMSAMPDRNISFVFADPAPKTPCPYSPEWRLLSTLRKSSTDEAAFDAALVRSMTLVGTPGAADMTLTEVWSAFQACLEAVHGLVFADKYHRRYLAHAFEAFAADGISFVELRQVFQEGIGGNTYALDGTLLPWSRLVDNIAQAAQAVEGVLGVHVIACAIRGTPYNDIQVALQQSRILASSYPDMIVGFDLVGQEDPGAPLLAFVPFLLDQEAGSAAGPVLPYFFHAGETDVVGGPADSNLYDAILLNTTRIGHGYALGRHPLLRQEVKSRGIALEICPLSNQVLKLVDDLRNHPVHVFLSEGLPVTLAPDDPAIWGAASSPASFDWASMYYAMDIRAGGLAALKQMAINSIDHSTAQADLKLTMMDRFRMDWQKWVARVTRTRLTTFVDSNHPKHVPISQDTSKVHTNFAKQN